MERTRSVVPAYRKGSQSTLRAPSKALLEGAELYAEPQYALEGLRSLLEGSRAALLPERHSERSGSPQSPLGKYGALKGSRSLRGPLTNRFKSYQIFRRAPRWDGHEWFRNVLERPGSSRSGLRASGGSRSGLRAPKTLRGPRTLGGCPGTLWKLPPRSSKRLWELPLKRCGSCQSPLRGYRTLWRGREAFWRFPKHPGRSSRTGGGRLISISGS